MTSEPRNPTPAYYDIFLSHAWKDGEDFDFADKTKWILDFRDKLVAELSRSGTWPMKVEIFLDMESIQSGSIPQHITDALSRTLVFVCLVSKTYWQRAYCADEFETFKRNADQNPLLANQMGRDRVIPVLIGPLDDNEILPLEDIKFHELYDQGTKDRLPIDRSGAGHQVMQQLAVNVASVLRSIRGRDGVLYGQGGKAFVNSTSGLMGSFAGLQSELEYLGLLVRPERNVLPESREAVAALVDQEAGGCAIAVHGIDPESAPFSSDEVVPEYDAIRLMRDRCLEGQPQKMLIWTPRRDEADSLHYKELVDDLAATASVGVEVHALPFPKFRPLVFSALSAVDRTPRWVPRQSDVLPDGSLGVYLLRQPSDARDQTCASLRRWLVSLQDVKVWESADPGHGDPASTRMREEWILAKATSVIIFGTLDSMAFVQQTYRGKLKTWDRAGTSLGFYLAVKETGFSPPKGKVFCSADMFDETAIRSAFRGILPLD